MFDMCLADPSCAALYRQAVRDVRDTVPALNLDDLATSTASMLAPYETSDREEYSPEEISSAVDEVVGFIHERPAEAAAWLGDDPVDPSDPGVPPATQGASASSPDTSHKKKCKRSKRSPKRSGKCRKPKRRN
jgi:hypothetical protein